MNNDPKDDRILNADNDITNANDLPDSPQDKEKMKSETVIMDLPEVKDIPGQEFIHVPPLGELADTTISSDDEEGVGILDYEDDDEEIISNTNVNVTNQEREMLTDEGTAIKDGGELKQATLDNEDDEGEALNENSDDVGGAGLDVPGAAEDDANEDIGEEDEENNSYSLGGDKKD
ncbi:MAG: hypothetical protein H0V14_06710 [Chitinophagaceae bacterium]|nr:hypothetical protein [Chitinophagaceae bacterium]